MCREICISRPGTCSFVHRQVCESLYFVKVCVCSFCDASCRITHRSKPKLYRKHLPAIISGWGFFAVLKKYLRPTLVTTKRSPNLLARAGPGSFSSIIIVNKNQSTGPANRFNKRNKQDGCGSRKVSYMLITRSRARKNGRSRLHAPSMTVKKGYLTAS